MIVSDQYSECCRALILSELLAPEYALVCLIRIVARQQWNHALSARTCVGLLSAKSFHTFGAPASVRQMGGPVPVDFALRGHRSGREHFLGRDLLNWRLYDLSGVGFLLGRSPKTQIALCSSALMRRIDWRRLTVRTTLAIYG